MTELNDQPNYVNAFAQAYQAGRQQARERGVQNALSMAATDPTGAQNALIQYGDFQSANALAQNQAAQRQLATRQKAGSQFASGDATGAQNTAAQAGDFDTVAAIARMTDDQRAQAAHVADVTNRALFGLAQVPLQGRPAALQRLAPELLQQGVPQAAIDAAAQSGLTDDFLQSSAHSAMTVQQQIEAQQKDAQLKEQARSNTAHEAQTKAEQDSTNAYRKAELGLRAQSNATEAGRAAASQWQVLQDPGNGGQPYRYNTATGQATAMDGRTPYSPSGAQKLSSGNPRSGAALAVQQYMRENPNASAEDIASFSAGMGKKVAAAKAFGTGRQGDQVRSLNVSIAHLDQLGQLADALGNGNIQVVNNIANDIKAQLGVAAPTNFNAAKQIVGDEVVKAVVGSGGGVGDREKAQKSIAQANSPQQLAGVIKQYQGLLSGQLGGLKRQYQQATGLDDFENLLAPETAAKLEGGAQQPAASGWGKAVVVKH